MRFVSKTLLCLALAAAASCVDTSHLEDRLDNLETKIAELESTVAEINKNATALGSIVKGNIYIVGYQELQYGYKLELSDNEVVEVTFGQKAPSVVPVLGINNKGEWTVSTDNGETFTPIEGAENALHQNSAAPQLKINDKGYWTISYDGGKTYTEVLKDGKPLSAENGYEAAGIVSFFKNVTFDKSSDTMIFTMEDDSVVKVPVINDFYLKIDGYKEGQEIFLDETLKFEVSMSGVKEAVIEDIPGWRIVLEDNSLSVTAPSTGNAGTYTASIFLVSEDGLLKTAKFDFTLVPTKWDAAACQEWNDFVAKNSGNVLLDFSYAGYNHGETAPPDVYGLGYTVFDVTKYGAVANDGLSDRAAFIATLEAALKCEMTTASGNKAMLQSADRPSAKAIVYFPEGEFILHTAEDNIADASYPEGAISQSIVIRAGDFILKGAGRDKTQLVVKDEMFPTSAAMYSSPDMIQFKHNSNFSSFPTAAAVTSNAAKGEFSVEVSSAASIKAGDWVCLHVLNNDATFVAEELQPYTAGANWEITQKGVEVIDYHQVISVSGNKITFKEPLMHAVDASRGWEIKKYPHYANVGIEDLTFVGNAKDDFEHHGSWRDDGAFKPISLTRLVNSWMRRVDFISVSEACSIISSANVSAYDITFSGKRGHASIRSQSSSRVFIGATTDIADGNVVKDNPNLAIGTYLEGAGQYHGVGVSKPSLGAVLWRNTWGKDACFESHATQPRATLIDCCTGGWMRYRQGGDANQMPNHLADLTVWNFESLNTVSEEFIWWDAANYWWKFLPPIIVGFHGESVTFAQNQVTTDSSHGTAVGPESLYEAQLRNRLGYIPAWLMSLK